jgi:hypothetical protein
VSFEGIDILFEEVLLSIRNIIYGLLTNLRVSLLSCFVCCNTTRTVESSLLDLQLKFIKLLYFFPVVVSWIKYQE